ncbi:MAG: hypothetical protein L3J56_12130 [Bacteroidales bacterium]|nr:hypothetical protein [Bacteroidales bacterium]
MKQDNTVITELIKTLGSYGVGWLLLGLILLGIFLILYKSILSNSKIQDALAFWLTSKIYKVNLKDIKKHRIFSDKSKLKNKVDLMTFDNEPLKTKVFRVFFGTKLNVDTEKLKTFITDDFNKSDKEELHIKMAEVIEDMKQRFNDAVKPELVKLCKKILYTVVGNNYKQSHTEDCAEKLFEYVMYAQKGFDEYRTYRIESLLYDIELIRDSPIYDNNNERAYQFLSTVGHSIEKGIMRAAKIFEDFNGEIDLIFQEQIKETGRT